MNSRGSVILNGGDDSQKLQSQSCEDTVQDGHKLARTTSLLNYARAGHLEGWDGLVDEFSPMLWRNISVGGLSGPDAADVYQTVWLDLLSHLDIIHTPAALTGRLATSTARETWRLATAARRQAPTDPESLSSLPDMTDSSATKAGSSDVEQVPADNEQLVLVPDVTDSSDATQSPRSQEPVKPRRYAGISPQRLTWMAIFIAGRERADIGCEWRSHLAGETGGGLPEGHQVRVAAGFVVAAIRYRLQDLADLLWRPMDALLASRELSGLFVLVPTLWVSVLFIRAGGLYGLADHLEDVGVVWGAAYALIRTGRWWRDVEPPKRKPRRESE